jgi:type II secretory pathway component PulF
MPRRKKRKPSVSDISTKPGLMYNLAKAGFTTGIRNKMYKKIGALIRNGVGLRDAIESLRDRSFARYGTQNPQAIVLTKVLKSLDDGATFAEAMTPFVKPIEAMLIKAGEDAGDIPRSTDLAVAISETGSKMRKAIMGGMVQPIVLAVTVYAFLLIMGDYVVPKLAKSFDPSSWTGSARGLYLVSEFTQSWVVIAVPVAVVALLAVIIFTLPRWGGLLRAKFDRFPPWSVYRMTQGVGWLMSYSSLVRSGVTHERAMAAMENTGSHWLKERLHKARLRLRAGDDLGEALDNTKMGFPDREIIDDIGVYVSLDGFDEVLERMGHDWLETGTEKITATAQLISTVFFMIMGLFMIWIVLGVNAIQTSLSSAGGAY